MSFLSHMQTTVRAPEETKLQLLQLNKATNIQRLLNTAFAPIQTRAAWGRAGRGLAASHFRTLLLPVIASSLAHSEINLSKALQQRANNCINTTLSVYSLSCKMPSQAASSSSSHWNPLGWWRGCAACYQPQLRLWLLAGPNPASTAPASLRAGASRCEQIQTKSPQIEVEEFPLACEPSQQGSAWRTSSWMHTGTQCQGSPGAGMLRVHWTDSRWVGTGPASKHDQVFD